jgi:cytochrome c-type biogenesis protein CcmH/NrfF
VSFLRIIGIGMMIAFGANAVAANPPNVTTSEDWILWALGNAMIILAVLLIVNVARGRK